MKTESAHERNIELHISMRGPGIAQETVHQISKPEWVEIREILSRAKSEKEVRP